MPFLVDTDVAIHLRDQNPHIRSVVAGFDGVPAISAMTWVELEGGVHARPDLARLRRRGLEVFLREVDVIPVTDEVVRTYGRIVAQTGFSRRKIADRIIAATALAHRLTFATINAEDFRDVEGLDLYPIELPA